MNAKTNLRKLASAQNLKQHFMFTTNKRLFGSLVFLRNEPLPIYMLARKLTSVPEVQTHSQAYGIRFISCENLPHTLPAFYLR